MVFFNIEFHGVCIEFVAVGSRGCKALGDPYCQSTSLSGVSVVGTFDAKYLGNYERFRGSCPIRNTHVDWWHNRWRHVTLWRHTRDVTMFKVVGFGTYDAGQL